VGLVPIKQSSEWYKTPIESKLNWEAVSVQQPAHEFEKWVYVSPLSVLWMFFLKVQADRY
jgi:hypothetical protein